MSRLGVARSALADVFRMSPWRTAALAPLGLIEAATRMLAAGLLMQFAVSYSSDSDGPGLDLLGIDFGVDVSASRVWFWVAAITATALAAAGSSYARGLAELRIGRRYSRFAAQRTLDRLADDPYRGAVTYDPSFFVYSSSGLLGTVAPALQVVGFGAVMFALRPGLTLVVAAAAAVFLGPAVLLAGRRIGDAAQRRRSSRNVFRSVGGRELGVLATGPLYHQRVRHAAVEDYVRSDDFTERFESLYSIRSNNELARLMSGLFAAATAMILAVGLTVAEEPEAITLGDLVFYIIIAQFAAGAIGRIGVALAIFNRHAHRHEAYVDFVSGHGSATPSAQPVAHAGEVWVVRSKDAPAATVLVRWLDAIGVPAPTAAAVVAEHSQLPPYSVESLAAGGDDTPEAVRRGVAVVEELIGRPLTGPERSATARDLPEGPLSAAVVLAPAVAHGTPLVVVLPIQVLGRLDRRAQLGVIQQLSRHHVVLVGRGRDYLLELADRVIDEVDMADDGEFDETEDDE